MIHWCASHTNCCTPDSKCKKKHLHKYIYCLTCRNLDLCLNYKLRQKQEFSLVYPHCFSFCLVELEHLKEIRLQHHVRVNVPVLKWWFLMLLYKCVLSKEKLDKSDSWISLNQKQNIRIVGQKISEVWINKTASSA